MEIEAGKVHFLRLGGNIQAVKPGENPVVHPGVDFRLLPQIGEGLASEGERSSV
jgi:hypothetical protein